MGLKIKIDKGTSQRSVGYEQHHHQGLFGPG